MRNNETGRSMVEMLGVLAIMGILSIGGIAGYTYAMNRLKANDIIDGVNKRAVALSTYTLLGTGVSATTLDAEFANKIGDFPVALAAADPGFTLTVSEITRPVCNHVLNNGVQMARTITLGATKVWENGVKADYTCAEDGNTIVFTFAPAAGESGHTPTCGYCQHVENGICVADKTCDNHCPGDKPMKNSNGICVSCSPVRIWASAEECSKCSNRFMVGSNDCYLCSYATAVAADSSECAKCPNREMKDGKCVVICTAEQFRDSDYYCRDCSYSSGVRADSSECAKCPNRKMKDGKCLPICTDEQFTGLNDSCYDCSDVAAGEATAAECAKCSNRFMSTNGTCYHCSVNQGFNADATECAKCSNREIYNEMCTPICSDGELKIRNGGCYACSYNFGLWADESECAKCPNRKMKDDGYCVRK